MGNIMKQVVIVMVLTTGILLAYDNFVAKPRFEAERKALAEEQARALERTPEFIKQTIKEYAREMKLSSALALAIAEVESTFNPDAIREERHKNTVSVGLFQMFLPTAKDMGLQKETDELKEFAEKIKRAKEEGFPKEKIEEYEQEYNELLVETLKNPKTNISYGVAYLAKCKKKYGYDVRRIACCHNAGLYSRDSVCQNDKWVIHYQNKVEKAYLKYAPVTTASL